MRTSSSAALEEAESIWWELLQEAREAGKKDGEGHTSGDEDDGTNSREEAGARGPADAGYIESRLFNKWSQVCCCVAARWTLEVCQRVAMCTKKGRS